MIFNDCYILTIELYKYSFHIPVIKAITFYFIKLNQIFERGMTRILLKECTFMIVMSAYDYM